MASTKATRAPGPMFAPRTLAPMSVGAPMMLTECCFTARSLRRLRQLAKQVRDAVS
jgi:hypothetical protein